MELSVVEVRGSSPMGFKDSFHRHPRNACANIPKGKDNNIHVQFISWNKICSTCLKLKSRYIQYRIPPPKMREMAILNMSFPFFFTVLFFSFIGKGNLIHGKYKIIGVFFLKLRYLGNFQSVNNTFFRCFLGICGIQYCKQQTFSLTLQKINGLFCVCKLQENETS